MARSDSGKAPRYDRHQPSSLAASRVKKHNRSEGTKAELTLRRHLWARGLRYCLHVQELPGKPDIVFRRQRVAIFVDGDFWHGRNWTERRKKLEKGANADYWIAKIEYNIERDLKSTVLLREMGWDVLRIWETDVLSTPDEACEKILQLVAP